MLVRALRHLAGVPALESRSSVLGTGETRVFRGLRLWSIEELEASAEEFAPADLPGLVGRLAKRGSRALHLGRRMTRRPSSTPHLRWRDPRHLSTMDEKAQGGLRNNARRHHAVCRRVWQDTHRRGAGDVGVYAVPDHPQRLRASSGLQNLVEGPRVEFVATLLTQLNTRATCLARSNLARSCRTPARGWTGQGASTLVKRAGAGRKRHPLRGASAGDPCRRNALCPPGPRPTPRLPRRLECPDQDRSETRPPAVHHDEFEMGRVRGVLGEARPHRGTQSIAVHVAPGHLLPLNFR